MALLDWIVLLIIDNQLTTAMVIKTFFHGYYDPSEKKEKKKKNIYKQVSIWSWAHQQRIHENETNKQINKDISKRLLCIPSTLK